MNIDPISPNSWNSIYSYSPAGHVITGNLNVANIVVVVWWLYFADTLNRELICTNAYILQAPMSVKEQLKNIMHGLFNLNVMQWPFCWVSFLYDLALSCIYKL